ncbi:glycine-rich domain-containing protein [Salinispora vitiensis]|uniref:glycine-rich domain-containing protein n=1 Tax=Salinispora vitiensis TaxID=999544 RepID=UPI001CC7A43B|nr:hypothetical protein [Salinispora vitiensis]
MYTTTPKPTVALQQGASLVSPELFVRLTTRIAKDHPDLPTGMADRILDQALAFLGAAAVTTVPIGPSDLVDIGWHTFILYTRDYAAFCDRVAGRFIHHDPAAGSEKPTNPDGEPVLLSQAIDAITAAGYQVDSALWNTTADCVSCSSCRPGGGGNDIPTY